jgi:hypothetical protein
MDNNIIIESKMQIEIRSKEVDRISKLTASECRESASRHNTRFFTCKPRREAYCGNRIAHSAL